jgi:hypothetical protein
MLTELIIYSNGAADKPQDRNAEGVPGLDGSIRMIGRRRRTECELKSRRADKPTACGRLIGTF